MAASKKLINYHLILLVVVVLLFMTPFFIQPKLLSERDNDLGRTYIPIFQYLRNSFWENRSFPLWRPEQMMGETFIGNPLFNFLYPVNMLFLLLPTGFASVLYYTIHLIISAIATLFLAKSFKFSETSAFSIAIFYTFSNKLLLHISAGHITMVASFALFPALFLGVRLLLLKPSIKVFLLSSLSACFMLITYPTVFYYAVIFILFYSVYFLLNSKIGIVNAKKKLVWITSSLALALLLSAIFLIPQLEFAKLSTRSTLTLQDIAQPTWNIKKLLSSLFFPFIYFNSLDHEAFLYMGFVPLILAAKGFLKLKQRTKIIILVFGFISLLFVAGTSTPLFAIAYKYFPLLKYSRITTRPWFIVTIVVVLLAGFGLEKIKNKRLVYLLIAIFLTESFIISYQKIFSVPKLNFSNYKLYEYLSQDRDLFRTYCTSYCFNPQQLFASKLQLLNGETPLQLTSSVYVLQDVGNYKYSSFAVIFPPYQVWQVQAPPQPNADVMKRANVKYIASTYKLDGFQFVDKYQDILLYKNANYKSRYYFEKSDQNIFIEKYSPNEVTLKFDPLQETRRLVISESYYPGWIALINNKKYEIKQFDRYFKSVQVPTGSNQVNLKFLPDSFVFGKTITIATILFLTIFFWYNSNKNLRV